MIKAFLFDCGGVVLRDRNETAYETWGERLGLSAGELRESLYGGTAWKQAEVGQLTEEQYWVEAGDALGLQAEDSQEMGHDLWSSWAPEEQVLKLIDELRPHCRVAMLSNATDALEHMLGERFGIADRFDPIFNSARLGLAKPDPAIYEHVLKELGLKAQEVVFIDDRAENVAAAAALGIHVVWFVDPSELARQLAPYSCNGNGGAAEKPYTVGDSVESETSQESSDT